MTDRAQRWFLEKINRTDKSLAQLIRKEREKTQITSVRKERGGLTTVFIDLKKLIRKLSTSKLGNLEEWANFLKDVKYQSSFKKGIETGKKEV